MSAVQFRQWATSVLRDFAIRSYVIDRQRMENGTFLGEDYFDRLLDEIREIRLFERRFYQKITDIYATSIDYNKVSTTSTSPDSTPRPCPNPPESLARPSS